MPLPTGSQQRVLSPAITVVEGAPVPAKMTAVQCPQGSSPTAQWVFLDQSGNPVDITDLLNQGFSCRLAVRETLSQPDIGSSFINCTVTAGTPPVVSAVIPSTLTTYPGISILEWAVMDGSSPPQPVFTNLQYLIVNMGQLGQIFSGSGPPSVQEIRLALRDADPSGNLWLGTFEWDLAEIAWAIARPIAHFNEAPPPIDQWYTTANFPWRHNWLNATSAYLMRTAADWYRRVHLPYQSGGLSIDDKNKFSEYDQRGKELLERWEKWVQWKKVELNCNSAYQSQGSSYSNLGWY